MTIEGTFTNGVIVLDNSPSLPEGTRVQVVVPSAEPRIDEATGEPTMKNLLKLAGKALDLPADFAAQHDHYIHGTPLK